MERGLNNQPGQAGSLRSTMEEAKVKKPLPSRSEIHRKKRKKNKRKIKFPLLKLLALFFILMPIAIYSLYTYFEQGSLKSAQEEDSFEMVELNGETEEKVSENSGEIDDEDEYKFLNHTVKDKETIYQISQKYYKSVEGVSLIQKWNGLNGNEVHSGQVLKIPIKK